MLDEDEYERVMAIWLDHVERAHELHASLKDIGFYDAVSQEYERITGVADVHPTAIGHHRLSLYGPPCEACEKPLRSPKAKLCAACGKPVQGRN